MDFQGFLEAESRAEKWTPPNVRCEPHSASNCCGTQITSLRGCGWYHGSLLGGGRGIRRARKEQGRRRSIPLTALPAPDIKIGSRRPVVCIVPRDFAAICDPFHIRKKKLRRALWRRTSRGTGIICSLFL